MGVAADAEQVEQAFAQAGGEDRAAGGGQPADHDQAHAEAGGQPQRGLGAGHHAAVHAQADQGGQAHAHHRVQDDQGAHRDQGPADRAQQACQAEAGIRGARIFAVQDGNLGGGWQRADLGQELGGRWAAGQSGHAATTTATAAATSAAGRGGGRGSGFVDQASVQFVLRERRPQLAGRLRDGGLDRLVRARQEVAVESAAGRQLVMRADVDHPARVQDGDPVGQGQGRTPVSHQECGAVGRHGREGRVDGRFGRGVHRGRRVVEQQDARVGEQGAGQGHALALAAGQGQAPFADHGVVAEREGLDEVVRLGCLGGALHLRGGGVGAAVRDVREDRVGEEEGLFEDHAHRAAQRLQAQRADVGAAHSHGTGVHVVETG